MIIFIVLYLNKGKGRFQIHFKHYEVASKQASRRNITKHKTKRNTLKCDTLNSR